MPDLGGHLVCKVPASPGLARKGAGHLGQTAKCGCRTKWRLPYREILK